MEFALAQTPRRIGTGVNVPVPSYREGLWTPTLSFGGASTGITYGVSNAGVFRKMGSFVELWGDLNISSKGSATGDAAIGGLPFSIDRRSGGYPQVGVRCGIWNGMLTNIVDLSLLFVLGFPDRFFLFQLTAAGTSNVPATVKDTDVGNTMELRFFISHNTNEIG